MHSIKPNIHDTFLRKSRHLNFEHNSNIIKHIFACNGLTNFHETLKQIWLARVYHGKFVLTFFLVALILLSRSLEGNCESSIGSEEGLSTFRLVETASSFIWELNDWMGSNLLATYASFGSVISSTTTCSKTLSFSWAACRKRKVKKRTAFC